MVYILFRRSFNDLIINIRNIHNESDVILKVMGHDAPDDIKGQVGAGVTHMTRSVDGGTAPGNENVCVRACVCERE